MIFHKKRVRCKSFILDHTVKVDKRSCYGVEKRFWNRLEVQFASLTHWLAARYRKTGILVYSLFFMTFNPLNSKYFVCFGPKEWYKWYGISLGKRRHCGNVSNMCGRIADYAEIKRGLTILRLSNGNSTTSQWAIGEASSQGVREAELSEL